LRFPALSAVKKSEKRIHAANSKNIKASFYVHSDFGFHQERIKPGAGMSLQRKFSQEKDLKDSIAETAQKHIYACQAGSLRTRGSKAEQSISDLKTLLHGGSCRIQALRAKIPRTGSHSYAGAGISRSKTFHQERGRVWTLPDISTKSLDHIGRLVVVEKK
jgi:hypothetical protein